MPRRHFLLSVKQYGAGEDLLKIYHLKRRSARSRIHKQVRLSLAPVFMNECMHVQECMCAFITVCMWIFCLCVLEAVLLELRSPAGSSHKNSPCHIQYIITVKGPDNDAGPVMFHAF